VILVGNIKHFNLENETPLLESYKKYQAYCVTIK